MGYKCVSQGGVKIWYGIITKVDPLDFVFEQREELKEGYKSKSTDDV